METNMVESQFKYINETIQENGIDTKERNQILNKW